jgi:L-ascorbate oxidase
MLYLIKNHGLRLYKTEQLLYARNVVQFDCSDTVITWIGFKAKSLEVEMLGARAICFIAAWVFAPYWITDCAAGTPTVTGRTCTDLITIGQPLCDPGHFNAVADRFDLFAKARLISIIGANDASRLPAQFMAYTFDLNTDPRSGSLAPPIWHIPQRYPEGRESLGTIRFNLHNQLPPVWNNTFMVNGLIPAGDQPLNLHTHGLMVLPHDSHESGSYGDFVGVLGCPAATKPSCPADPEEMQMTEVCGMAKSAADGHACVGAGRIHGNQGMSLHGHEILFGPVPYAINIPGHHPASINWFHPHAHEISSPQVGAGLAGVITVGSLCSDQALSATSRKAICKTGGEEAELKDSVKERVFMLKDLQIFTRRPGGKPFGGSDQASAEGYRVIPACKFDKGQTHIVTSGFCAFDPPDSTAPGGNWLFTVNGQIQPTISMEAGRPELWRIANVSSNATYKLSLCKSDPKPDKTPNWTPPASNPQATDPRTDVAICDDLKRFRIISLDGGLIPGNNTLGDQTEALLLPGARAEIVIEPEAGEMFKLVQKGFEQPDLYPPVVLATATTQSGSGNLPPVSFEGAKSVETRHPSAFEKPEDCEAEPAAFGRRDWASLPTKDEVVSIFFERISDDPEVLTLGLMRGNPETSSEPGVRSKITACLADGDTSSTNCQVFSGTAFTMERRNLCLKYGTKVTFRLYNLTDETHNFHIHQQKFSVDVPEGALNTEPSIAAIRGNVIQRQLASKFGLEGAPPAVVDSVPVLSAWVRDENGKVIGNNPIETVTMKFDRPEQVGDFVFHCHILEHEDKGMMKRITVYTEDRH